MPDISPYRVAMARLTVNDIVRNLSFPAVIFYPTKDDECPTTLGPFAARLAHEGALPDEKFPVIAFSHGGGGSPFVYHNLVCELVRRGFIIVMPIHPGNNREDNSLADTIENLERRPNHLSLSLTTLLESPRFAGHIDESRIAAAGHSMGGYTTLASIGAKGWTGIAQPLNTTSDPRYKAAILMAPTTGWFPLNDSLAEISIPTLLLYSEHDHITPRWQAQLVMDLLPTKYLTSKMNEKAGHFSYLSPFPPAMATPSFPPSQDPAGFDRAGFQRELTNLILKFLFDSFESGRID